MERQNLRPDELPGRQVVRISAVSREARLLAIRDVAGRPMSGLERVVATRVLRRSAVGA